MSVGDVMLNMVSFEAIGLDGLIGFIGIVMIVSSVIIITHKGKKQCNSREKKI